MIERVGRRRTPNFAHSRMQAARLAAGWTRGKLAAMMQVGVSTISSWERGNRVPEPPHLLRLAQMLAIDPADLIDTDPEAWTLLDYRIAHGLLQQEAAERAATNATRLRNVEFAYERMDPRLRSALASLYGTDEAKIDAAWQNGLDKLLAE